MSVALALSTAEAASSAAGSALPYFHMGALELGPLPIQAFGVIVAAGVLIGAALLRRYAEWHGVSDDHIRGLTGWITVTGFIGAHVFDVLAYQWPELEKDPLLLFKLWAGISSYGGFLGGAMGFAFYVWWKRLPPGLMADIGIVGLLPAFSIGRIGCTVVSDHIGRAIDPNAWYSFIAMDYPRPPPGGVATHSGIAHLAATTPGASEFIPAWNLGLVELLYLVPVNALILFLAFRRKRLPAGFLIVLTGVLYAPVRFFLDYLRPESSDPRYFTLTFAQWSSVLAFGVAAYAASRVLAKGKPAETIAPTAKEAQELLTLTLKEDDADEDPKAKKGTAKPGAKKAVPVAKAIENKKAPVDPKIEEEKRKAKELEDQRAEEKRKKNDADEIAAAERRKKQDDEFAAKEAAKKAEADKKKAEADAKAAADAAKPSDEK